MSKYTNNTRQTDIHAVMIDTAVKFTEKSMLVIRSAYKNTGIMTDEDGVMDIVVSFDGVGHSRGVFQY